MSINVLINGKLIRLDSDTLTSKKIVDALGYTPADEKQLFSGSFADLKDNPIIEDGNGALQIADPNGNIIARLAADGITTTNVNTKTIFLNGENIEEKINAIKGAILTSILDDSSDSFSLVDPDGNIIFRVDKEGTATTEIILGATDEDKIAVKETLQDILSRLDNIVFEETDPTVPAWAKQPNKPTYTYSEIKDTPIQEDNSGALDIVDAEGRIAAKIDGNGTRVAKLFVGEEKANEKDVATQLNELAANKVDKNLGIDNQGKFLTINEQGEVTPIALEDIQLPEVEFDETNSFGTVQIPLDDSGEHFIAFTAEKPGDELILQAGDNVTISQGLMVDNLGNGKTTVCISATGGSAAGSVDKLTTPREIELTGDVTGSAMFDGSQDIQINTEVEVKYEDVQGAPDIIENEDGSLSFVDEQDNIAARIGSNGIEASQVITDTIMYQGQKIDTRLFPYVESLDDNQSLVTKDGNWIVEDRITSWDKLEGRPFGSVVNPGILQFELDWDENSQLYLGKLFNVPAINEGMTYNITMPGVLSEQVTKTAKNIASELSTTLFNRYQNYLGNIYMVFKQGQDTQEDFFILGDLEKRTLACCVRKAKTTDRITLNVSITAVQDFYTIPEEYLPQTVATTGYVENYVENNSTKIQFITWERGD